MPEQHGQQTDDSTSSLNDLLAQIRSGDANRVADALAHLSETERKKLFKALQPFQKAWLNREGYVPGRRRLGES